MNNIKKLLTPKVISSFFLICLAIYFLYKCPFESIFGICCPGCGMTRAFIALIQFDITASFHYHPLYPIVIVVVIYLILKKLDIFTFSKKTENILLYVICTLFFVVYFIRLFGDSDVVYYDFKESLIGKLFY